jgi:hypothetical protein
MPVTSGSRAIVWTVIVIAVVVNAAGYALNWYQEFWWFDKVLHAYTTFAVTLPLALLLYGAVLAGLRGHRFVLVLTIVNLGVALGALWEIAEFGVAGLGEPDIESRVDTVMDLIMDLAGGVRCRAGECQDDGACGIADVWTRSKGKPEASGAEISRQCLTAVRRRKQRSKSMMAKTSRVVCGRSGVRFVYEHRAHGL